MSFARAYLAEIQSIHRGRFALLGAGILTALVATLAATVGPGDAHRPEYLVPAYLVAPLLFIPIVTVSLARPRAAHFLEGVFTAPVTPTQYLFAKAAVGATLGAAYLLATLPFGILQTVHLGQAGLTWTFLLAGFLIVLYANGLGLLLGSLFTGRSTVAPLVVSIGTVAALTAALVFLRPVHNMDPGTTRDLLLAILHVSGPVLVHDALRLPPIIAQQPVASAACFLLQLVGFVVGAWYVRTRAQSPHSWERRVPLLALVAATALVIAAPVSLASDSYKEAPDDAMDPGSSSNNATVRLTGPSLEPPRPEDFPSRPVLIEGRANPSVLWIFLHEGRNHEQPFTDVKIQLRGEGLEVHPASFRFMEPGTLPKAKDSEHRPARPYLRLPIEISVPDATRLGQNVHVLHYELSYQAQGAPGPTMGGGRLAVYSEVEHIHAQLAASMGAAPLLLLGAHGLRQWRLRQ